MPMFSEVPETIPATVLCRHSYASQHKTAVVIGLPQSGTSMLAAVVDALGVPMTAGRMFNFEAEDGRPSEYREWDGTEVPSVVHFARWYAMWNKKTPDADGYGNDRIGDGVVCYDFYQQNSADFDTVFPKG